VAARARLGGYTFQVRLVLILVVLFLAALNLVNLALLRQARASLDGAERERAVAVTSRVVAELGRDELLRLASARDPAARAVTTEMLRRRALRASLVSIQLLDAAGRPIAGADAPGDSRGGFPRLDERDRDGLRSGRAATGPLEPRGGGEEARLSAYVPILDGSGRIVAVVRADIPAPELGRLESDARLVLAVQVSGVLVLAGLAVLFANWVSRPYRRLAAAVGEAGLASGKSRSSSDPYDLAEAFRAVVGKLRDQEEALGALGREGGGLGDLVRFASGPARSMTTGVLVLDRQARVAAMNPAARAHLGIGDGEARDVDLRKIAGAIDGLERLVRACLEQRKGVSREVLPLHGADGRAGHLGVAISPALGFGGEPVGVLVLTTDLTEIRRLQEQARLRESLAAVGQLSAGIAHEFRNALGTILGWARMLEKREDPRVSGPAREIVREVDSVRNAVDEFLLYARPPEPARTVVDLEELVRAQAASAPEGAAIKLEGEFGPVVGDEGLLRRAFGNLIQNAHEAAAEAGTGVRIRIVGRRAAGGRMLQVEVDDDGPGIPPERRSQVFVPFFTTRSRGTGLGLALVQRTVVDMGGSVEVGEGPRGGALFRLRFPLPADDASPSRSPEPPRSSPL